MNPFPRPLLLLLLLVALPSVRGATPMIGAQLFQDTNARINDLFEHRDQPPKRPGPRDNPFRPVELTPVDITTSSNPDHPTDPATQESRDESILRLAYGRLKFGGIMTAGDDQRVVINKISYKEGGILPLRVEGIDIYLRIVKLTRNSITLGLNEARLELNF